MPDNVVIMWYNKGLFLELATNAPIDFTLNHSLNGRRVKEKRHVAMALFIWMNSIGFMENYNIKCSITSFNCNAL